MPRRARGALSTDLKISIDAALAGQVEMLLLDPIHGKAKYGSRSKLIERLLRDWVDSQLAARAALSIPMEVT